MPAHRPQAGFAAVEPRPDLVTRTTPEAHAGTGPPDRITAGPSVEDVVTRITPDAHDRITGGPSVEDVVARITPEAQTGTGRPDRITGCFTAVTDGDFFVRTVGGLEGLVAAELAERGCTVLRTSRRQLVVRGPGDALWREPPRTADDLFRLVLTLEDPGRRRGTPAELGRQVRSARFDVPRPGARISVSASFVGPRAFSRYDLEDEIGAALAARWGGRYWSRRDGRRPHPEAVDWRVTLDGDRALVGLRPGARPLHRRPWKTASIPGTLHPPVAAAMARLAGIRPGQLVVDPCCGAGTVLIEAAELCPAARFAGGDIDPAALAAASTNRRGGIGWQRHDSAALPYLSDSVDRIVTNPPWGVRVAEIRALPALLREWRRVIRPDGRLICLADPDQLSAFAGRDANWRAVRTLPISLSGRHPQIVVAHPDR